MGGYLSVAIGYQLTQAGVSVENVAALVAFSYLPQTWKFLWAPIADTTLSRKTWYLLAAAISSLGIFVTGAIPADEKSLPLLYAAVLVSNVAVTFLAMASESLMIYNAPPELHGRAGGWFQAGNLGGNGIGGGAGLWLAQTLPAPWMAAAIVAIACALCAVALWFVPEPARVARIGALRPQPARRPAGSLAGRANARGNSGAPYLFSSHRRRRRVQSLGCGCR